MFAAPLQVTLRTKEGVFLYQLSPDKDKKNGVKLEKVKQHADESCQKFIFSKFGQELILLFKTHVIITDENDKTRKIVQDNVLEACFSPKRRYIVLLCKYTNVEQKNLFVYSNVETPVVLLESVYKPDADERWPLFHWSDNEKECVMVRDQKLLFFSKKMKIKQTFHKKKVREGVLSPSGKFFAITYRNQNKKLVECGIFDVKKPKNPIASTFLSDCDDETIVWNNSSSAVLIYESNQQDANNDCYYGTSELSLLKRTWKVPTQRQKIASNVLDYRWNFRGNKFMVTHSSPPRAELYNEEGKVNFKFPEGSRDKILFSKGGNTICGLCGSGSFNGVIEFWDLSSKKIVGKGESDYPSQFEFSPDSNYILTSTITPVLYDSNKIQLWGLDGELKCEVGFETLYQAQFFPRDPKLYPKQKKKKFVEYVEVKKKDDVYVPPFLKQGGVIGSSGVKRGGRSNNRGGGSYRGRGGGRGGGSYRGSGGRGGFY